MTSRPAPLRIAIAVVAALLLATLVGSLFLPDSVEESTGLYKRPPENAQRVFFIGNSHTFFNDLPDMVQRLAHSDPSSPPIWLDGHLQGGAYLRDHLNNPDLGSSLRDFDFVVIQGASLEPVTHSQEYVENVARIVALANETSATPILYEVWPRAHFDPVYRYDDIPSSPELLAREIRSTLTVAATQTGARLAPAGGAWERARRAGHPLVLHLDDGNHATPTGTYLAALVIYGTITAEPLPRDLWHPSDVSPSQASLLTDLANAELATQ